MNEHFTSKRRKDTKQLLIEKNSTTNVDFYDVKSCIENKL